MSSLAIGFIKAVDPSILPFLLLGIVLGLSIGMAPGLGGNFALAVLLPFIYGMEPHQAIAFLLGAHSVVATGGSVTAILCNTPGTGMNAATLLDGFPMTRQGQAGRALGSALAASGLGGVIGAAFLALLIPVLRPVILAFSTPEFFMLTMLGLCFVGSLGGKNPTRGLIAGGLGVILSLIGYEPVTGVVRYNFGSLYLYDGLKLVPVTLGLFAVAEMFELAMKGGRLARQEGPGRTTGIRDGVMDVFRHWGLFIRCSLLGAFIGAIPGLGGEVATFLAYGHARQTSRYPEKFGTGVVEGVIAPEAANNAKEGGAILPTVGFGIPGSSSMAILLGAFMIMGVSPGPNMLNQNLDLIYNMVAVLVVANLIGAGICLFLSRYLVRITLISGEILVPIILALVSLGAYALNLNLWDVVVALVFGLIGYLFRLFDFSRPALLVGFVLGHIIELNLHLSIQMFGPFFVLQRPIAVLLLVVLILTVLPRHVWGFLALRKEARA